VFKPRVDAEHPRVRELEALGCPVTDLSRPGPEIVWDAAHSGLSRRLTRCAAPFLLARVVSRLRFRRPDIAIVSQGANFDGIHLARLCDRLGIPYMLVSQKASHLQWPTDQARPSIRRSHEGAVRSVFVSEHNRGLTGQQLNSDLANAVVLHNPVLAGAHGPLAWPEDDGGPTRLAFIARMWLLDKGQDLLFEVLARPRWRQRVVSLSLYGQGHNRQGLEDLARRLRLDNVSFYGHVEDVESIWRTHHGLVLASRSEGLPLVVQEAMACGRPPIVTDAGGLGQLVEDGVTGFVADSPSVAAIDSTLDRAWSRRHEWEAIGRRAAERVAAVRRERGPAPLADLALEQVAARRDNATASALRCEQEREHPLPAAASRGPSPSHGHSLVPTRSGSSVG
jgi:glycosyltransferase involved in cell wall biosynthesis